MPALTLEGQALAIVPGRAAARLWPVLDRARQEALRQGQAIAPEVLEAIDSLQRAGEAFLTGQARRGPEVGLSAAAHSRKHEYASCDKVNIGQERDVLVTTAEAANLLGVCTRTIRNHWRAGKLPGRLIGGRLLVSRAVIEEQTKEKQ